MRLGILGKKLGMTQLYTSDNVIVPVTVIEAGPCDVVQKKTMARDKYSAIQLGFLEKRASLTNMPGAGHFKAAGVTPKRVLREIRFKPDDPVKFEVGQVLRADLFSEGDVVDVVGTSKGKGFQGVMKRHNFKGFENSHGTHEYFRHGGSIGCRLTPGRTWPGKRMGGQMGNAQVTAQNLQIFRIDVERNLIYIRGAIPGPSNGIVTIYNSKKRGKK